MTVKMFSKNFNPLIRNMLQIPLMSVKRFSNDVSLCIFRQNFSSHIEENLNVQIGQELYASHSYLAMSNFFARTEISLIGSASFFLAMSNEERDHALQLINYQNMRGGRVVMQNILKPKDEFTSLLMAFEQALLIERNNTTALMELVGVAEGEHDIVTADFIVSKFLNEQMKALQSLGKMISRLKRFEQPGLGEYLIDSELQKEYPSKDEVLKI